MRTPGGSASGDVWHGRARSARLLAPSSLADHTTPHRAGARVRHHAEHGPAVEAEADHHHVAGLAAK